MFLSIGLLLVELFNRWYGQNVIIFMNVQEYSIIYISDK